MNPPEDALRLRLRIHLGAAILIGPGRADLLAAIDTAGSIAAAGRQIGMSYKRAWALVESMNKSFKQPLIEAAKGGAGGGGARLTAAGRTILAAYRELEAGAAAAGGDALSVLAEQAVPPPPKTV